MRADGNYCNKMKYSDTISPSQYQDIAADFHNTPTWIFDEWNETLPGKSTILVFNVYQSKLLWSLSFNLCQEVPIMRRMTSSRRLFFLLIHVIISTNQRFCSAALVSELSQVPGSPPPSFQFIMQKYFHLKELKR